ncbi:AAA family ATPase [Rhodococcus sp. NPDC004095]
MVYYFNIADVLDNGGTQVLPDTMRWAEDQCLFYSGKVNSVFGDPESGKTWVALAAVAAELGIGKRVAFIDIDHNGVQAIAKNLLNLGVDRDVLVDQEAFRCTSPDDEVVFGALVADLVAWGADLVVLDSIGELLPIFSASSNDSDDYTHVHRRVLTPLAQAGAAVVVVDHLSKGDNSRAHGPTGTMAKRRATGGVMLRITVAEAFSPGRGGRVHLNVFKDRHGGVRSQVAHDKSKEPLLGDFVLVAGGGDALSWYIEPRATELPAKESTADKREREHRERVDQLLNAGRMPSSIKEAQSFLRCSQDNAKRALDDARDISGELKAS